MVGVLALVFAAVSVAAMILASGLEATRQTDP